MLAPLVLILHHTVSPFSTVYFEGKKTITIGKDEKSSCAPLFMKFYVVK